MVAISITTCDRDRFGYAKAKVNVKRGKMTIIIHKSINNLEFVHPDDKDELKQAYDLKVGDIIICDGSVYVAHDEGYGEEYLELFDWQPLGISEWVLCGGQHPQVVDEGTYSYFSINGEWVDVLLIPAEGKTLFINKQTGEVLGKSDFPCDEFEPEYPDLNGGFGSGRRWMMSRE